MKAIYWLGLLSITSLKLFGINPCFAQTSNIVPDDSLGAESSQVTKNIQFQGLPVEEIRGGAQRGINLFHSFQEFNVSQGRGAYFLSPNAEIQNILARVTGGNPSDILGTLGTVGGSEPNLFLINPNGIVFGESASLDVGGSFVASTANGLQFGEQGVFSATNPEAAPLLRVNPSALFFNQINQKAEIRNSSIEPAGTSPSGIEVAGLRVPDGKSLLLIGGNVSMDGGRLNALGGKVELGGLAEPGTVALDITGDNFKLGFSDNVAHTSVLLNNQAGVFVQGAGGGDIAINARNIEMSEGSRLVAGIGEGLGTVETFAGDISLNSTGEIKITDFSAIGNLVNQNSKGNGGNVIVNSDSLSLQDGSQIQASTRGQGSAGNVVLNTDDTVNLADNAAILSTVEAGSIGNGGDIDINAASLSLTDGAQLVTVTRRASDTQPVAKGNSGNINVKVSGIIDLAGEKNRFSSAILTFIDRDAEGNGGNITIDAGSLKLQDVSVLSAATFGKGNAGSVKLNVKGDISLTGGDIFSSVEAGGVGKGGDIDINATSLSLTDGAQLLAITRGESDTRPAGRGDAGNVKVKVFGVVDIAGKKNRFSSGIRSRVGIGTEGNAGDVTIDASSVKLRDAARLSTSTSGRGNAGNVMVTAKDGVSLLGNVGIFSTVGAGGVGKGGNIDINAARLLIADGSQLQTGTNGASDTQPAGRGDAGNVNVKVSGEVDIVGKKDTFPSGILSLVNIGTEGNGGNIIIDAGSFKLRDGAQLQASTVGRGNAGNVRVSVKNAVSLTGVQTTIFSTVEAGGVGKGGNIDIDAARLLITDGAQIQTSTNGASDTQPAGRGNAGNVNVKVSGEIDIAGQKELFATAIFSSVDIGTEGDGGDITIDSDSFKLRDGALLDARTLNNDRGGNITVNTNVLEILNGGQFTTTTSSNGDAGKITVNAGDKVIISGSDPNYSNRVAKFSRVGNIGANSGFFVRSTGSGTTGDIEINSSKITLDNQGILNANSASGDGGNINLKVDDLLLLRRGAEISTDAGTEQKGGDGGNIDIDSKIIIAVPQEDSNITANAFEGRGGNIDILSQGIFGIEPTGADIPFRNDITASSQLGITGNINLNAPDNSSIQNSLSDLQQNPIDTNALIANSCIARSRKQKSTFNITGAGGLPQRPGDAATSNYPTGEVQNLSDKIQSSQWKPGEVIIEPQGVYELPSGQLILSRECD